MHWVYSLSGGTEPLAMKFQVNETLSQKGIPVLAPGAGNAGVQISTTGSLANAVGVTEDTATYVSAQQTDGTSAEREVTVIIDPWSVWRAKMSGGAAEDTALTKYPITTASSTGNTVTTSSISDWTTPAWNDGVVWFWDGANVGQKRKVTSGSGTATTATVAFDQDTIVGDNILRAPYWPLGDVGNGLTLTTNLYQAEASQAVGTGGEIRCIDLILRDQSDDGANNSSVDFMFDDHALRDAT